LASRSRLLALRPCERIVRFRLSIYTPLEP
jgi:hypothetical protein